jgi:hypothetical protein
MTKEELRSILSNGDFHPSAYSVDADDWMPDDGFSLRFEDGQWIVYYSERGYRGDTKHFASEADATRYLLDTLTSDRTARRPPQSHLSDKNPILQVWVDWKAFFRPKRKR